MIIGFYTETDKQNMQECLLPGQYRLQRGTIVPNLTRKQREETKMMQEAERKNENLTEDLTQKLQWTVVGSRTHTRGD
jgi:hypothetical protein